MKTIKIGLSCSPSTIICHEKISVTKVLISYGGGVGGLSETYYATKMIANDKMNNNGLYTTFLIDGDIIELNPKFIVSKATKNVVKVVSDVTAHANFSQKKCKEMILTEYFELRHDEDYEIMDTYNFKSEDEMNQRIIHKLTTRVSK